MIKYNQEFLAELLAEYPHVNTEYLALKYGITSSKIYNLARNRNVKKSAEYISDMLRTTNKNLLDSGKAHRFEKGHASWNKGKYMRVSQKSEFKKGHMPHNYRPVGSERITRDGYLERKVADPKTWKGVHLILWEEVNGPIPPRHKVIFLDNNKKNIVIENLLLVTFEESMRRNSIHRYPIEIKQAIKTISKLKKTIRNHGKKQN